MAKLFLVLLSISLLSACSPRDEEVNLNDKNRGVDLETYSNKIVTVSKEGQKLPSCSEEGKPTWDTIRFFHELNFIFPKIKKNELSIVVAKGDFNCVKVSNEKPIELVTQKEPRGKDYENTGSFVYVKKIQMMDTGYLLNDTAKLSDFADGMGMTVGQLIAYLKDRPKQQVTVTYISKNKTSSDGDDNSSDSGDSNNNSSGIITLLQMPGDKGKMVGDCSSEWKSLRLQKWFKEEHKEILVENINNKTLKIFLGAGDKHCLVVGGKGGFEALNENGDFVSVGNVEYEVQWVMIRYKSEFEEDPLLSPYVAEQMGMNLEMFQEYLSNMKNDKVNLTFVRWIDEVEGE